MNEWFCMDFFSYSSLLLHLLQAFIIVSPLAYNFLMVFLNGVVISCYAINSVFSLVNALTPKALPDPSIC